MADTKIAIPDELFETGASEYYAGTLPVSFDLGADHYEFLEPVDWCVTISNACDSLVVLGSVSGTGKTRCARCLEDTLVSFQGEIEGSVFLEQPTEEQLEGFEEDEYVILADDEKILDLEPLIIAGLVLEAPGVPLCREDCAGLCSRCGANLNEGPCSCADSEEDDAFDVNPFAVLKGLNLN